MKHHQIEFSDQQKPSRPRKLTGKYGRLPFYISEQVELEITAEMKQDMQNLAIIMRNVAVPEINSNRPAGYTYLGQFIAHDMSFDPTSIRERQADLKYLRNFRTPALDLDSVYGGGPAVNPYLYTFNHNKERIRFLLPAITEKPDSDINKPLRRFYDLPRLSIHLEGTPEDQKEFPAVIPDPRNDENIFVSQLHVAFMYLHNYFEEKVATGIRGEERFNEAQRQLRWHFQYIVIHDYLKTIVDSTIFRQKLPQDKETVLNRKNLSYFKWKRRPFIPIEFSGAIFRFGHSQVRSFYQFNDDVRGGVFEKKQGQLPKTFIDWKLFFSSEADAFSRIDQNITPMMFTLPHETNPIAQNLIYRNLVRGLYYNLPSGQSLVRAMGLDASLLDKEKLRAERDVNFREFEKIAEILPHFLDNTPLWYYTLLEAKILGEDGNQVGPMASHIIAEVIIGLIQSDKTSYLYNDPNWTPGKPDFSMADLLDLAGIFNGVVIKDKSNAPQT